MKYILVVLSLAIGLLSATISFADDPKIQVLMGVLGARTPVGFEFLSYGPGGLKDGELYLLKAPDAQIQEVLDQMESGEFYQIAAAVFGARRPFRNGYYYAAHLISAAHLNADNLTEPGKLIKPSQVVDSDPLATFAAELRPVLLTDPQLPFRAQQYRRFLGDSLSVPRVARTERGRNALFAIRRLVLANVLFTEYPKTRDFSDTPEVADFLNSAASLWTEGAHGVFESLVEMIEDHLDPLIAAQEECADLLAHFHEDRLTQARDQKDKAIHALARIAHRLYTTL